MESDGKTNGVTLEELKKRQREANFEAAVRAGDIWKDRILSGDDMHTADAAAAKIGITPAALEKLADERRVLRLEGKNSRCRYPDFQFEEDVFAVIEKLFAAMPDNDPWGIYLFLTKPDPALYPGTPLEWIKNGKEDKVLWLADALSKT